MKQYLIDYFIYNDWANTKLLETILNLPDRSEALHLFSHLISAQNKWYNRVSKAQSDRDLSWYDAVTPVEDIGQKWKESYELWLSLLNNATETDIDQYVIFSRQSDGKAMKVKMKDIVFQLNCHSVHHRAQINKLISSQGVAVPATDYIFTAISDAD